MAFTPPNVKGSFHAYFIFDVADTIDLARLVALAGAGAERAPLRMRATPVPGRIQFAVPPVAIPLPAVDVGGRQGAARAKVFDFGVVSIRYTFDYSGPWTGYSDLAIALRNDDDVHALAQRQLDGLLRDYAPALNKPHDTLVEDYSICTVESFAEDVEAATLLTDGAPHLVTLMMAEAHELGPEEQREALRLHFSYFPDDLVIVLWDSAFVYESREDAQVIEDILEFANSQLVEFRTYDARLDDELDAVYAMNTPDLGRRASLGVMQRRRTADQRAQQLRSLLIDVRELADRATNALKIIGDAYYARIYRAIAARLGLDDWQRQIDSKLDSIGEVYRYLIDQAQTARSEFLELIVIVLIAIEIVVGLIGLRR